MAAFRVFLVAIFLWIVGYTAVVVVTHGFGLIPIFFGDMAEMAWPGQFNLDFMGFLFLSANWVLWRHHYSAASIPLAILAFFGGIGFLAPYLLYVSVTAQGDMKEILLGQERAASA